MKRSGPLKRKARLKPGKPLGRSGPTERSSKRSRPKSAPLKARPLTKAERVEQMKRDGYLCQHCGMDVAWAAMHIRSTLEAATLTVAWKGTPYSGKPALVARLAELPESFAVALMRKSHEVPAEVDHIVPRELQGGNEPENLQTLCCECHKAKSASDATAIANAPSHRRVA